MQRFTTCSGVLVGALATLFLCNAAAAQPASATASPPGGVPATAAGPGNVTMTVTRSMDFPQGIWNLTHENDWFIYSDRDFTGNLRLAYTTPNASDWSHLPAPSWLGTAFNHFSFIDSTTAQDAVGAYANLNMYTPDVLTLNPPNPRDHPYAGWTSVGYDMIRQSANRRAIFEVNLGLVGPTSGGEQLQKSFHSLIGSTQPAGWAYQIKDEPVLQLTYRQDWRPSFLTNLGSSNSGAINYDVIGHIVGTAGNGFDYAATGLLARLGYHLPADYGAARPRLGEIESAPVQDAGAPAPENNWAYLCLGAEARAVARDITVDGNTFTTNSYSQVNHAPFVAEYYGGMAVEYGWFRGSFLIVYESHTFNTQPQAGQWRGVLSLGVAF